MQHRRNLFTAVENERLPGLIATRKVAPKRGDLRLCHISFVPRCGAVFWESGVDNWEAG